MPKVFRHTKAKPDVLEKKWLANVQSQTETPNSPYKHHLDAWIKHIGYPQDAFLFTYRELVRRCSWVSDLLDVVLEIFSQVLMISMQQLFSLSTFTDDLFLVSSSSRHGGTSTSAR